MNELVRTVYLYALSSDYRVIHYSRMDKVNPSLQDMKVAAWLMLNEYPGTMIFAISANSRYAIYKACVDSMKKKTLEDRVVFKVLLEAEGLRIF